MPEPQPNRRPGLVPGGRPTPPRGGPTFSLAGWNAGVPLLLVPVRLETAYVNGADHDELRIRILPDPASVAGAAPASAAEIEEGRAYWTADHAATSAADRAAVWRRFAGRLGSRRAGYVARLTQPAVAADGTLTFPDPTPQADGPAAATLLPDRWLAIGWVGERVAFQAVSQSITRPLFTSPDPAARPTRVTGSGLVIDPATAWLFDYDSALDRGMAITVPLTGTATLAAHGLSTLIVVGLDENQRPDRAAADLTGLLEQHTRGAGLAFVPQGTPTNNTDTVAAGYRFQDTDFAGLQARELRTPRPSPDDNAARLARALGLDNADALRRLAYGSDQEARRSRDMRTALYQTVLGSYVSQLLATHARDGAQLRGGIGREATQVLRSWFTEWVTGGAPVPTIRVGQQPYGILPVMGAPHGDYPTETKRRIAQVVDVMREEWRAALAGVPALDHNDTDADPDPGTDPDADGDADTDGDRADAKARDTVTAVLANNPHPRRIIVRSGKDWSDEPPFDIGVHAARTVPGQVPGPADGGGVDQIPMEITGGFRWEYDQSLAELADRYQYTLKPLYDAVLQQVVPNRIDPGSPVPVEGQRVAADPAPILSDDGDIRGIEEQLEVWTQLDAAIDHSFGVPAALDGYFAEFHDFVRDVIEQLTRHDLRQRPLRWLEVPGLDGVLGRDDLQLLLTSFTSTQRPWQRATVQDDEPPAGVTAQAYLNDLASRVGTPTASTLPGQFLDTAPLLFQLVETVNALGEDKAARREALQRLAAVDPADLDWLLRETLGLGTHRLDAWNTSLASERLSALRDAQPDGLYVGAFGFVLGLVRSPGRASNGFLHAPSLAQAASAAVLRSGWLARGGGDGDSPAAIDLSSQRVRQAQEFLAGVRQGQDLGDLLGAQLERSLHDAVLDVAIRPLRLVVAAADGLGEAATDQPVDGIRLLDLYRAGQLSGPIGALGLPQPRQRQLLAILDSLASAFDAVDDVTTFESVHQLVVGNLERAAAVTDAMGPDGGRPPELTGVRTTRDAATIDNRALVLIGSPAPAANRGWASGTRDRFDPQLDAWVATLLPPPAQVGWTAVAADGTNVDLRLDRLAVSALDAVWLADDNPESIGPGLRRLTELAHPEVTLVDLFPAEGRNAPTTLTQFQLLAVELRRLIQSSSPADARALLGPAEVPEPGVDVAGTVARATDALAPVLAAYDAVAAAAGWTELTAAQAAELARLGLTPAPGGDPAADFAAVRDRLARRRDAADAAVAPDTIEGVRQRVAELIGSPGPVLATFTVPAAGAVEFSDAVAGQDEVDDWLDIVGSVRPKVGALTRTVLLSGLLGMPPPTMVAGQLPLVDGESWVALHRPRTGTLGRIAAAALTHGTVVAGGQAVGLVVDSWAERIPADEQVTGVAFHYDSPSAEAAQSMLLVLTPEDRQWSTDLVIDTLLDTVEWAQLRAVAIDDLGDYGQAVPTVVVSGALAADPPREGQP
ncbi:hypothetical protein [Rugosimonospora africana]|uniref:Uncharacterized protein n=1 Tax=Rugosimonospora africana TaxID=556532 RepID=A0A8J3QRW3_9ACTN|nr:hypothetical protein [Rugosimonospora africana]GIH15137.1 hypothetical protein Raf01_33090 [Rugosimonospora africana]